MFRVGSVLPAEGVLVGVTLSVDQRPAASISTDDVVRAYLVPKGGQSGDTARSARCWSTRPGS